MYVFVIDSGVGENSSKGRCSRQQKNTHKQINTAQNQQHNTRGSHCRQEHPTPPTTMSPNSASTRNEEELHSRSLSSLSTMFMNPMIDESNCKYSTLLLVAGDGMAWDGNKQEMFFRNCLRSELEMTVLESV